MSEELNEPYQALHGFLYSPLLATQTEVPRQMINNNTQFNSEIQLVNGVSWLTAFYNWTQILNLTLFWTLAQLRSFLVIMVVFLSYGFSLKIPNEPIVVVKYHGKLQLSKQEISVTELKGCLGWISHLQWLLFILLHCKNFLMIVKQRSVHPKC